jgi:hypothetical protein
MDVYAADVERKMQRFFGWLSEQDRRRYAAVEAATLGHGGVEYIARVLACDPQTIRQGLRALAETEDAAAGRIRKKGADARSVPSPSRPEKRTAATCDRSAPLAIPCVQVCCGRTCRCARCHAGGWRWARLPVAARSDGCSEHAQEGDAQRGRKRPWAITPTATRNVKTSRACGARMRRPAMRSCRSTRKSMHDWEMFTALARPSPPKRWTPLTTILAPQARGS